MKFVLQASIIPFSQIAEDSYLQIIGSNDYAAHIRITIYIHGFP